MLPVDILLGRFCDQGHPLRPIMVRARGAESSNDFMHKVRVVLKELNETSIWLRIIERSELLRAELLTDIIAENVELCKIFATTIRTARSHSNVR